MIVKKMAAISYQDELARLRGFTPVVPYGRCPFVYFQDAPEYCQIMGSGTCAEICQDCWEQEYKGEEYKGEEYMP